MNLLKTVRNDFLIDNLHSPKILKNSLFYAIKEIQCVIKLDNA